MHIPDGFLDAKTWVTLSAASAAAVAYAARQSSKELEERQVPLLGVLSAFIFAAQMLNFPVVAGTSGHLLGVALAAILLGPWTGAMAITAVLIIQALIFQDGGITALGANVFNMAVAGTMVTFFLYRALLRLTGKWYLAASLAAWASVVLAAGLAGVELAISGTSPWHLVIPAMVGIHALIGLGEAVITAAVLSAVRSLRPDLVASGLVPAQKEVA